MSKPYIIASSMRTGQVWAREHGFRRGDITIVTPSHPRSIYGRRDIAVAVVQVSDDLTTIEQWSRWDHLLQHHKTIAMTQRRAQP